MEKECREPEKGGAGESSSESNCSAKAGYERKGMDVYTTVSIPYTTAVFGGEARVHTLYGDVMCKSKKEPSQEARFV